MADRTTQPSSPEPKPAKPDRSAQLIHELATDPPAKDIASVKAASDVFEASKKRTIDRKKELAKAH